MTDLDTMLYVIGYRPEDDCWESDGRRTYIHDDDATRAFLTTVRGVFGRHGWRKDMTALRTFKHDNGETIEIEPGGDRCEGHYLHHMKAWLIDGDSIVIETIKDAYAVIDGELGGPYDKLLERLGKVIDSMEPPK